MPRKSERYQLPFDFWQRELTTEVVYPTQHDLGMFVNAGDDEPGRRFVRKRVEPVAIRSAAAIGQYLYTV